MGKGKNRPAFCLFCVTEKRVETMVWYTSVPYRKVLSHASDLACFLWGRQEQTDLAHDPGRSAGDFMWGKGRLKARYFFGPCKQTDRYKKYRL